MWACWERNPLHDLRDWLLVADDFNVDDDQLAIHDTTDYPVQRWDNPSELRDAALYSLGYFTVIDRWAPDVAEPGRWYTSVVMMHWRWNQH